MAHKIGDKVTDWQGRPATVTGVQHIPATDWHPVYIRDGDRILEITTKSREPAGL